MDTRTWIDALTRSGVQVRDLRGKLPRNEAKVFGLRAPINLEGMTVHHSAVRGDTQEDLANIARYHVGPNHIAGDGCPGLCYTGAVLGNGTFCVAWDLDVTTWSQGDGNATHLGILVMGDFYSPSNTDGFDPTREQWNSCLQVWRTTAQVFGWDHSRLFGHFDFGKPACPGDALRNLVRDVRDRHEPQEPALLYDLGAAHPATWAHQKSLAMLGFSPGAVDGIWGPMSKAALARFQASAGLPVDSVWGANTQRAIDAALKNL